MMWTTPFELMMSGTTTSATYRPSPLSRLLLERTSRATSGGRGSPAGPNRMAMGVVRGSVDSDMLMGTSAKEKPGNDRLNEERMLEAREPSSNSADC